MKHIETAIVSDRPGATYGRMYSMHKYWSKKSPDVIGAYIEAYTGEDDIVLDPFCGSGIVACEAVRRGRRAIAIDINPMATFISRMRLTHVNLSRLQWAFRDMKSACEAAVNELFVTKCSRCRKDALIEFIVRDGESSKQIAYRCMCSKERLFKEPDAKDKRADYAISKRKIRFWYPKKVPLPAIQREKFKYLHELFTRRNLIALSTILNVIEKIDDVKIQDVMKLAFTAALDKCSRLKPLSQASGKPYPSLSEGWVSVRFYAPRMWEEVNPWLAFTRSFEKVYRGKKESNTELKKAVLGTSCREVFNRRANVVILTGSAHDILNQELSRRKIDYVLTDPPFGDHIQYLALSTLWGAWLKLDFNYDKELIVNRYRGKTREDYERYLEEIIKSIRKVLKPKSYIHMFYHDVQGPYLHKMLQIMERTKISAERILHQPPPKSFGAGVRGERGGRGKGKGIGHYGSYIVRGRATTKPLGRKDGPAEKALLTKIANAAVTSLEIAGGVAPIGTVLHSVYQHFGTEDIAVFARHGAEEFLADCIKSVAEVDKGQVRISDPKKGSGGSNVKADVRKAILDAKALYGERKNQIYQSVLCRFQDKGITLENVRNITSEIEVGEVGRHRKKRYCELLLVLGKKLAFRSVLSRTEPDQVVWQADEGLTYSFLTDERGVSVRASRKTSKGSVVSEIGVISFENLEPAVFRWCTSNLRISGDLKGRLNPPVARTNDSASVKLPQRLSLRILGNEELCHDHYLLTLKIPRNLKIEPEAGQFFHIICDPDGKDTVGSKGEKRGYSLTLRRPFSIHRVKYAEFDRLFLAAPSLIPYEIKQVIKRPVSEIDILYKVVGEGTQSLSEVTSGRYIDAIGPIGRGFGIKKVDMAVIVAGGIGVAPLVALAERLRYLGSKVFLYFGALRSDLLRPVLSRADSVVLRGYEDGTPEFRKVIESEFAEIGAESVIVCTDDGSLGKRGRVTDILENDIKSHRLPSDKCTVYACGPSEMMKAISQLADRYEFPCQVLLEERMACGIGACFSCTCHTKGKTGRKERKRVCVDGPVFNSKEIKWPD